MIEGAFRRTFFAILLHIRSALSEHKQEGE